MGFRAPQSHLRRPFVKSVSTWLALLGFFFPLLSHSEMNLPFKIPFCKTLLEKLEARVQKGSDFKVPEGWQVLMTRFNNVNNQNYLRNITRSTFKDFAPWFLKKVDVSFEQMLREQHISTITGTEKGKEYLSVSGMVQEAAQLAPGKMRNDPDYPAPDQRELINLNETSLRQINFPRELISQMRNGEVPAATQLRDIPPEFWTKRDSFKIKKVMDLDYTVEKGTFTWVHAYAEPKAIPTYLKQMDLIMSELRDMPKTKQNRTRAVLLLARYHQLFINALPFARVNNSIAMSHVNYVLLSFGLKGIPHEYLDLICLVMSTEQYQEYFLHTVLLSNSKL